MLLANLALNSTAVHGLMETAHGISLSALALQVQTEPVAVSHLNETVLMWFVIIAAVALVAQAIILAALAIGGLKIAKDLMKIVEEVKSKALPLVDTTRTLVTDLTPQIKQITNKVEVIVAHVETISGVAVEKVHEFSPTVSAARETVEQANQTVRDANHKTHQQIIRVNEMITGVLDATSRAGVKLQRGISMPGREAAGLVSGIKATFEHLVGSAKHFGEDRPLGGKRSSQTSSGSPNRTAASPYRRESEETAVVVVSPETREFGR